MTHEEKAQNIYDEACHCGCGDLQDRIASALAEAEKKGREEGLKDALNCVLQPGICPCHGNIKLEMLKRG